MSVHAAVTGDVDLLKQAMLHDPLVGAICTPEEVWQMVDEMLVAQAAWLPQYADAVPAARERLKTSTVKTATGRDRPAARCARSRNCVPSSSKLIAMKNSGGLQPPRGRAGGR